MKGHAEGMTGEMSEGLNLLFPNEMTAGIRRYGNKGIDQAERRVVGIRVEVLVNFLGRPAASRLFR